MKKKVTKQTVCRILLCLILTVSIALPSCDFSSVLINQQQEESTQPTNSGSKSTTAPATSGTPLSSQAPGSQTTPSEGDGDNAGNSGSTTTVIQNNVVINGGSGDVSHAAALGLQSIVSVESIFNQVGTSYGSGVIYQLDPDTGSAFIITNYHVVYSIYAKTANKICNQANLYLFGMEYTDYAIPATYVGGSANYDIAVLYVESSDILKEGAKNGTVRAASLANSDDLAPGQTAIAIGNPEAYGISVTTGIISVASESLTMQSVTYNQVTLRVIRIDSAVNHGNSGGGLFNAEGELIGIVNAKIISDDVENIGYAIPSNVARAIADNIIDYCHQKSCESVMRAILGVTVIVSDVSTAYNEQTGLIDITEEITVYDVTAGSLAYNVFQKDDIITRVTVGDKTTEVTRQYHLIDAMLDARVGELISTTVIRNGVEMTLEIIITQDCLTAY